MKITTIGLDLAKSLFHVICFDAKHHEPSRVGTVSCAHAVNAQSTRNHKIHRSSCSHVRVGHGKRAHPTGLVI